MKGAKDDRKHTLDYRLRCLPVLLTVGWFMRQIKTVLITTVVVVSALFLFSYLREQNKTDNQFACDTAPIIVSEGDTLFQIAKENCVGNFMKVVDELVLTYGSSISVGQAIYLPTNESCELRLTDGGQVLEDCI